MSTLTERYNSIAIILHWVMAVCFSLMIVSGLIMTKLELEKSFQFQLYQWHKSLGVLLLLTFVIRLCWRAFFKPPELPTEFFWWESIVSKIGHWLLYLLMLTLPIAGWIMVSSSVFGIPTIVFGWFEWPHIPGIAANATVENTFKLIHRTLAYSFIALIIVHVGAVIKHALVDKKNLLCRMWFYGGSR